MNIIDGSKNIYVELLDKAQGLEEQKFYKQMIDLINGKKTDFDKIDKINLYKSEILYLYNIQRYKLIEYLARMILSIKNYIGFDFNNDEKIYVDIIENKYSNTEYIKYVMSEYKDFELSPLLNKIISDKLRIRGEFKNSEYYYLKTIKIINHTLNHYDSLQYHNELFNLKREECPLCGKLEHSIFIQRIDGINLLECDVCGLVFTEYFPSKENISKMYDEEYYNSVIIGYRDDYNNFDKYSMFSKKVDWINNTINNYDINRTILDIGCATGEFLELMKKEKWNVMGLELSEFAAEICRKKDIDIYDKPVESLEEEEIKFDCITMWDALEHFENPKEILKVLYNKLNNNGKIYISLPNTLKYKMDGEQSIGFNSSYEHLIYFEPDTIIKMLQLIGFKVEQCFCIDEYAIDRLTGIGGQINILARK